MCLFNTNFDKMKQEKIMKVIDMFISIVVFMLECNDKTHHAKEWNLEVL